MFTPEPLPAIPDNLCVAIESLANCVAVEPGVFALTSCDPGEGVSFTIANLAIALAARVEGGVVLVDANLDDAVLSTVFGIADGAGSSLRAALSGDTAAIDPVPVGGGLQLLPAGSSLDGGGCLATQLGRVLASLRTRFSHVLVDLPSLASAGSASGCAAVADRVALVVEAERTRWQAVAHANEQLTAAGATVAGVVLNKRQFPIPEWLYRRL
ncbi:MAG: CpsD/CapB family tyrosine-protein kinase [bacterium]|nr:CpsD/CapB family tyrosine-protein kinase [bacterium]